MQLCLHWKCRVFTWNWTWFSSQKLQTKCIHIISLYHYAGIELLQFSIRLQNISYTGCKVRWSKYPAHKFELVSQLNTGNSEIFVIQTWTPNQRCYQVLSSSKHYFPIIIDPPYLCIREIREWKWKSCICKPYYASTETIERVNFKNGHIVGISEIMLSSIEQISFSRQKT